LVNFYQTTRRYNPEDSHLRTHRRQNLKSYFEYLNLSMSYLKTSHKTIILPFVLYKCNMDSYSKEKNTAYIEDIENKMLKNMNQREMK
jgi:hypothetical protein